MEGEDELLLGLNQAPSMNAVLKALKREESSAHNCIASIADDALFVQRVAARYPGLPLFANLRCGLWYVRPPVRDTCYFKSTDGHNNNWSFSTVRLNLNVVHAAAAAGGCVIADATKRGKRFPDAMSKTVPMWAAVLNRAIARLRAQQQAQQAQQAQPAVGTSPAAGTAWDCDVHLPPWVSEVEANSIRQRLDGWVDSLFEVGADLSALAAALRKPLRCLWVSQDSCAWEEGAVDVSALPFTPIVLIGASHTKSRQRRCLTLPPDEPGQEPLSVSYLYHPGAADDEESWAGGLSPALMWRHLRALLAAGPTGAEALTRQLIEQQHEAQRQPAAAAGTPAAALQPPQRQRGSSLPGPASVGSAATTTAAALPAIALAPAATAATARDVPLQQPAERGLHCLLPAGCLPARAEAVQQVGPGIFLLGDTGLAISGAAAAAAPAVWQHAGAVLHLGLHPLAGMQNERRPWQQQPQQPAGAGLGNGGSPGPAAGGPVDPTACRYCWLPVRSSKEDRHALQEQLPAALRFAAAQLAQRRTLLLSCDSGCDVSVCVAVACLLAFYRLDLQPGGGTSLARVPAALAAGAAAAAAAGSSTHESQPTGGEAPAPAPAFPPAMGAAGFSKLAVRQHLAAVSAHHPAARPTRGSLRQVFNLFLLQNGSTSD